MAKKVMGPEKKGSFAKKDSECDCNCFGWKKPSSGGCGGAYGLGFIGALFYFMPQATGFWSGVLLFLKSLVWPAFLVHSLLKFLGA